MLPVFDNANDFSLWVREMKIALYWWPLIIATLLPLIGIAIDLVSRRSDEPSISIATRWSILLSAFTLAVHASGAWYLVLSADPRDMFIYDPARYLAESISTTGIPVVVAASLSVFVMTGQHSQWLQKNTGGGFIGKRLQRNYTVAAMVLAAWFFAVLTFRHAPYIVELLAAVALVFTERSLCGVERRVNQVWVDQFLGKSLS